MGTVSDNFLRDILTTTKTIVMVGLSMNETRPSYFVGRYLHRRGFKIIPVNAGHGGKYFFGQLVMSSIDEISEPVDMVDIFRKPEAVPQIVDDSLAKLKGLRKWRTDHKREEIIFVANPAFLSSPNNL